MSFFAPPKDPRIEQIESSFFYWSIKYGKIMFISANRIKTLKRCNLCIPKYRPGTYKECDFTFSTLNSFKRHVLSCEFKFKRPLMWANKKAIPETGLKREREIGDLRTLEKVEIMRIEFKAKSIVKSPREMVKYFRANGCHCKDQLGQKCNVNLGSTFLSMFYHLAHIERQLQDYVVFKATPAELSNYEALEKQAPNPKSQAAPQNRSFQHRQPSIRPAFAGPVNTSASWRQANPGLDSFASASSLNTTIGFRLPNLSNPTRAHRESGASTMDSFHQTPRSTTSDFPNRTTVNSFIRIDLAKASGLRSGHQIRPRLNSRMYYGKKIGPTLNAA